MNKVIINKRIYKNLKLFYSFFSDKTDFILKTNSFLSVNKKNGWPNFIINFNEFGKNNEPEIEKLSNEAQQNKSLVVFSENNLPENKNLLKKHFLQPVALWKGMFLKAETFIEDKPFDCFTVEKVKTKGDLKQWFEIVNTEVLKKNMLNFRVFEKTIDNPNFSLYLGKDAGEPVATSLTFNGDQECGLYFISTLKNQRGKGFGSKITRYAINQAIKNGQKYFVLHATKAGESIYKKIGFSEYMKIYLFASTKELDNEYRHDTKASN